MSKPTQCPKCKYNTLINGVCMNTTTEFTCDYSSPHPTNDSPASVEEILTRLRAGIDPDTKQPHITWAEATARINQLLTEARNETIDMTVKYMNGLEIAWRQYRGEKNFRDFAREWYAALKDGGKK